MGAEMVYYTGRILSFHYDSLYGHAFVERSGGRKESGVILQRGYDFGRGEGDGRGGFSGSGACQTD